MSTDVAKIKTTGELREFLAGLLPKIEKGTVDLDAARTITKMAGQINESFYAEVKIARTLLDAGKTTEELGQLAINSKKP